MGLGKLAGIEPPSRNFALLFGLAFQVLQIALEGPAERHRRALARGSGARCERAGMNDGLFTGRLSGHLWPRAERLEISDHPALDPLLLTKAPDVRFCPEVDREPENLAVFPVAERGRAIVGEVAQRLYSIIVEQFRL